MKRVLITGGAGFIGFHLAKHLVNKNYQIDLIDNLSRGKIVYVCPMIGCWIEIKDSDSGQIIRVKVQDDVIIFPEDSKEKKVIVNGVFTKIEFTEDQAVKWKIHLAEEKGLKLEESDVTLDSSDLIEYRIKGLGAKIITELN